MKHFHKGASHLILVCLSLIIIILDKASDLGRGFSISELWGMEDNGYINRMKDEQWIDYQCSQVLALDYLRLFSES